MVEVRRSRRRRRTVSAYRDGERIVVLIPDRFSPDEEMEWVNRMLARLARRARNLRSDDDLLARTRRLADRYLADHQLAPASVRWVDNQRYRWGSCTPEDATIRISDRVRGMPDWVIDYVILHELVHLIVPTHGSYFWALVSRYPKAERARGYLEGVSAATQS